MQLHIWCMAVLLSAGTATQAQEVRTLDEGQQPATANMQQMEWLTGYWEGSGFGGDCIEVWTPAADNAMQGIFRFVMNDTLVFTEYMHVFAHNNTLAIKLKHFSRDLSGWEEQAEWTTFPLVAIEGQTAYFNGLTYARTGNTLIIKLLLYEGDREYEEEFRFEKKTL